MEWDLSQLPHETRTAIDDIFRHDFDLKMFQAMRRQTAIAARNYLNRPRAIDDLGPKTMEVDSFIDAIWRRFYGTNYSENDDLLKFLAKRNPEIVVKATGTRFQVGYMPSAESGKSRFRKVYF